MRTAWYLLAVGGTLVGCGTKIAQTTFDPSSATPDSGDPIGDIPDAGNIAPAAFLVRVRNGQEAFADPLTGTRNITDDPADQRRDCSTGLFGKLAYNGRFYGAYFAVRGCMGDFADG